MNEEIVGVLCEIRDALQSIDARITGINSRLDTVEARLDDIQGPPMALAAVQR